MASRNEPNQFSRIFFAAHRPSSIILNEIVANHSES